MTAPLLVIFLLGSLSFAKSAADLPTTVPEDDFASFVLGVNYDVSHLSHEALLGRAASAAFRAYQGGGAGGAQWASVACGELLRGGRGPGATAVEECADRLATEHAQPIEALFSRLSAAFPSRPVDTEPTATASVLVVGGGPAGLLSALAAVQAGGRVLVVEKRRAYRRSVWFDLLPGNVAVLEGLGLLELPTLRVHRHADPTDEHRSGGEGESDDEEDGDYGEGGIISVQCAELEHLLAKALFLSGAATIVYGWEVAGLCDGRLVALPPPPPPPPPPLPPLVPRNQSIDEDDLCARLPPEEHNDDDDDDDDDWRVMEYAAGDDGETALALPGGFDLLLVADGAKSGLRGLLGARQVEAASFVASDGSFDVARAAAVDQQQQQQQQQQPQQQQLDLMSLGQDGDDNEEEACQARQTPPPFPHEVDPWAHTTIIATFRSSLNGECPVLRDEHEDPFAVGLLLEARPAEAPAVSSCFKRFFFGHCELQIALRAAPPPRRRHQVHKSGDIDDHDGDHGGDHDGNHGDDPASFHWAWGVLLRVCRHLLAKSPADAAALRQTLASATLLRIPILRVAPSASGTFRLGAPIAGGEAGREAGGGGGGGGGGEEEDGDGRSARFVFEEHRNGGGDYAEAGESLPQYVVFTGDAAVTALYRLGVGVNFAIEALPALRRFVASLHANPLRSSLTRRASSSSSVSSSSSSLSSSSSSSSSAKLRKHRAKWQRRAGAAFAAFAADLDGRIDGLMNRQVACAFFEKHCGLVAYGHELWRPYLLSAPSPEAEEGMEEEGREEPPILGKSTAAVLYDGPLAPLDAIESCSTAHGGHDSGSAGDGERSWTWRRR